MKKTMGFLKCGAGIGRFTLPAAFTLMALLAFASCNKDAEDDAFVTGAAKYKAEKPTACPITGEVGYNTQIKLYNPTNTDAAIYYTTDGTTPTTGSTLYVDTERPAITESPTVIRAISVSQGLETSVEAIFNYTINYDMAASPVADPGPGAYTAGTAITLSSTTEGATIYYTINGEDPTPENGIEYTENSVPTVPSGGITIMAIAAKTGMKNSAPQRFDYYATAFYKYVEADGSGGVQQDISQEDGDTWIDKAVSWLSANAEANTRYTLSLALDIPSQSLRDLRDEAFHNAAGVTFFITTPSADAVKVTVNAHSFIFMLTEDTPKTVVLSGAINFVGKDSSDNSNPVVLVERGGTLILTGNAKISGNISQSEMGGGVTVFNGGTFIMNGGFICGNSSTNNTNPEYGGGAVYVEGPETRFIMNGGEIRDNSSIGYGGGVLVLEGGTFTMNGGAIYGNTSANNGGGVYVGGGSTFTMEGGRIQGSSDSNGWTANTAADGSSLYREEGGTATAAFGSGGGYVGSYGWDAYASIDTTEGTIRAPRNDEQGTETGESVW